MTYNSRISIAVHERSTREETDSDRLSNELERCFRGVNQKILAEFSREERGGDGDSNRSTDELTEGDERTGLRDVRFVGNISLDRN